MRERERDFLFPNIYWDITWNLQVGRDQPTPSSVCETPPALLTNVYEIILLDTYSIVHGHASYQDFGSGVVLFKGTCLDFIFSAECQHNHSLSDEINVCINQMYWG